MECSGGGTPRLIPGSIVGGREGVGLGSRGSGNVVLLIVDGGIWAAWTSWGGRATALVVHWSGKVVLARGVFVKVLARRELISILT